MEMLGINQPIYSLHLGSIKRTRVMEICQAHGTMTSLNLNLETGPENPVITILLTREMEIKDQLQMEVHGMRRIETLLVTMDGEMTNNSRMAIIRDMPVGIIKEVAIMVRI